MVHPLFELLLDKSLDQLDEGYSLLKLPHEIRLTFPKMLDSSMEVSHGENHKAGLDSYDGSYRRV